MTENEKSIMTATPTEVREEGIGIARSYLEHRGYEVTEETTDTADIVAYEGNTAVLVTVAATVDRDGEGSLPSLEIEKETIQKLRRACLTYATVHDEVSSVRADLISITIVGVGKARLRHLVGAWSWEE